MSDSKSIRVTEVNRFGGDILVYFSDGSSVIYHAQFLYNVRNHDANAPIKEAIDAQAGPKQ